MSPILFSCLLFSYWGTPDGWHTLTQTNTNTFQYWAILAVKWWPLLPKYGHKSNKINGIEFFSLQNLYIYSQEPNKALNLPKFWPPIFPANRAKFYIVSYKELENCAWLPRLFISSTLLGQQGHSNFQPLSVLMIFNVEKSYQLSFKWTKMLKVN